MDRLAETLHVLALAIAITYAIIAYRKAETALAEITALKLHLSNADNVKEQALSRSIGMAEGELLGRKNRSEELRSDNAKATVVAAKATVVAAAATVQVVTEPLASIVAEKTAAAAQVTLDKAQKNTGG